MTALSTGFADAASTTLSSAKKLYTISGSANSGYPFYATTFSSSTAWGEIYNTNFTGWNAAGSIPSQSGNGFLLDSTVLVGNQISAGNWSGSIRLTSMNGGSPAGTISCSITVRASKYNSSTPAYTTIVTMTLTSQTLTSTATTFSLPSTSGSVMAFNSNEYLYLDCFLNISSVSGANAVRINRFSTDTGGLTFDPNTVTTTPGYVSQTSAHVLITDGYGGVFV